MLGIEFKYQIMENDKNGEVWIRITPVLVNSFADDETGIRGAFYDFPLDMDAFNKRRNEAGQSLVNNLQFCLAQFTAKAPKA